MHSSQHQTNVILFTQYEDHIHCSFLETSQSLCVILVALQRVSNVVEQLGVVLVDLQTCHEYTVLRPPVSQNRQPHVFHLGIRPTRIHSKTVTIKSKVAAGSICTFISSKTGSQETHTKKTQINTQQERSTQYQPRHYAYIWQ